jgi:hypothetical protein
MIVGIQPFPQELVEFLVGIVCQSEDRIHVALVQTVTKSKQATACHGRACPHMR